MKDVVNAYVKKNRRSFLLLAVLLGVVELVALVHTHYAYIDNRFYGFYISFRIAFFALNFITALFFIYVIKKDIEGKPLVLFMYIYTSLALLFACLITIVDILAGNGNNLGMTIAFLSTMLAVSGIGNIKPWWYWIESITYTIVIFVLNHFYNPLFEAEGAIGLGIFLGVSIFVQYRTYTISVREYKREKELEKLSYKDELTDVFNRRSFNDACEMYDAKNENLQVVIVDIDNFKNINDTRGHLIGDQALKKVTYELKKEFPDAIYRYGGDEFVIITELEPNIIKAKVNFINEKLKEFEVRISCGIASTHKVFGILETLKFSDRALYYAKALGKGMTVVYEENAELSGQ